MTAPTSPVASSPDTTVSLAPETRPLVEVQGLTKNFPIKGGILQRTVAQVQAVDNVDLVIRRGETLGLVGESGCGKTTIGRLILRLIEPSAGTIRFDGEDITQLHGTALRPYRRRMQIIFQDPYASLDPRTPIADSIGEGLRIHGLGTPAERDAKVARIMDKVGLQAYHGRRYPHEFSGGQRQRIGIARALVLEPDLVVCDEPVSALDVSIQAQVLNLLKQLQRELGLTYLFVAHNLGVVEHISDRVAVMYLGRVAELADRDSIYRDPRHPYTTALMSAIPLPDPTRRQQRIILTGDVPSPVDPPSGCTFHPRCWLRARLSEPRECVDTIPVLHPLGPDHVVACHFADRTPAERDRLTAEATDGRVLAPLPAPVVAATEVAGVVTRIVVAGESLIDLIVRGDGRITPVAGGGPYNTARTIGRLGGDVAWLGRLSRDRFGRAMRAGLGADGVDLSLVVDTDDPTTLALAELDADGAATYRFYVDGTSAPGLVPVDARAALSADPEVLHVGTLGLVLEPMADTLAALVADAPGRVLVMVDPNCRPSIIRDEGGYRARLDAVLGRADVVKVSTDDVNWLAPGVDGREWAAALVGRGARVVLLTAGAGGVVVVTPDGMTDVPVPPIEVVDTVGAGDAFGGGFVASWLERGLGRADLGRLDAVIECVERAVLVAALTCGRAGAEPPTRAEVARAAR